MQSIIVLNVLLFQIGDGINLFIERLFIQTQMSNFISLTVQESMMNRINMITLIK